MQKCITWTNNIQTVAQAIQEAQIHCGIKYNLILTPVFNRFAYLIHSFRSLFDNKPTIGYLYVRIPRIHEKIWERRNYLINWEAIKMILTSMKCILRSTILNQFYGK